MEKGDRKTKRLVGILLLSFLFFVSSAWVVFDELFAPLEEEMQTVTVPNFEGQALSSVRMADWFEVKTEYRYDESAPSGVILSQEPSGGSQRKIGVRRPTCQLKLTVSLGRETAILPDVVGEDVRVAEGRLREAGFAVKSEISVGAYPEGEVYQMSPRGGEKLPVGTEIVLYVSAGTPAVTVTVPDLRGLTRGEALTQIWLSQLSVKEVIEVPSEVEEGLVIAQDYPPGTVVMAGSRLTLTVSGRD
ncbi:MAG: PASTA domain-containing protein [Clostridia bacterium]|nr:PASTA domain-containing protein [Clostridia bacterium]